MDSSVTACPKCFVTNLVKEISDLKPGDHLTYYGMLGPLYRHHCIVVDVVEDNGQFGKIKVLGFEHCDSIPLLFRKGLCLQEKEVEINLKGNDHERIQYYHKSYSGAEIVDRARILINQQMPYNFLTCNCEHFCQEVCTGISKSLQVNFCKRQLQGCYLLFLYWLLLKVLTLILLCVFYITGPTILGWIFNIIAFSPYICFKTIKWYTARCRRCAAYSCKEAVLTCFILISSSSVYQTIFDFGKECRFTYSVHELVYEFAFVAVVATIMTYVVPFTVRRKWSTF